MVYRLHHVRAVVGPKLDVRAWNLTLSMGIALAGCTGGGVEAEEKPFECPPFCEGDCDPLRDCPDELPYDDYDADDDSTDYDDSYGDDTDEWECQSHVDCGYGEVCEDTELGRGYCVPHSALPVCARNPTYELLPTALLLDQPMSLAFVDADEDPAGELVVVLPDGPHLIDAGTNTVASLPASEGTQVREVQSADFDGDGVRELLAVDGAGTLLRWSRAEDGWTGAPLLPELAGLSRLRTFDGNGDGFIDIAAIGADGTALRVLNDGLGGFTLPEPFATAMPVVDLASGRFSAAPFDDVVLQTVSNTLLVFGESGNTIDAFAPDPFTERRPIAADLEGDARSELVTHATARGDLLLDIRADTLSGRFWAAPEGLGFGLGIERHAVGDVDGDGARDVVFIGPGGVLALVAVQCVERIFVAVDPVADYGDFDGDGRLDVVTVVYEDDPTVGRLVLYTRSDP